MYLRIRTQPSRLQASYSALHGQLSEARSAEERIREDQFGDVLKILAGRSPWQSFITKNLAATKLPKRPFRVVNREDFEKVLGRDAGHIPGVTDKRTGVITMLEWFGVNSRATFLGAALHEAVHLVSHHPGRSASTHSTARGFLGEGLHEGLVECVTIDILNAQRISLARENMRGHMDRVPVAVALLRRLGVPLLARVLFEGDLQQFGILMHHTYSVTGWEEIKRLTTANKPQQAIQRMNELRAVQERQRAEQLRRQINQIPARQP